MSGWRKFRPRPFELLALAGAIGVLLFLRARGLRLGWSSFEYMLRAMAHRLPVVLAFGIAIHLVAHLAAWRSPLPWVRAVVRPAALLLWARLWLALLLLSWAYAWIKVSVPLVHARLFDPLLGRLDTVLHFGLSPSVFAAELVAGTRVAGWLDGWYFLWLTSVAATQSAIFLSAQARPRDGATSPSPVSRSGWREECSTSPSRRSDPALPHPSCSVKRWPACRTRRQSRRGCGRTTWIWSPRGGAHRCRR